MKLFALLSLFSVASAFALTPAPLASRFISKSGAEHQAAVAKSPLFRNPEIVRGGAVPGWAAYNQALEEHPLPAKAATSLVGWALGDLLTQMFISSGPFDMKRFISFSAFGFLYHGPSGHYFYNFLDKLIPGTTATAVASKVAFDQIVWCPIFVCVFFTYLGLVNGDSFATIGQKIQTDLLAACQGSWKVWPFVHAVNFAFISNKHRLLFLNAVQVAFNMFLSIMGAK
eukprot:Nitzschia sp. Nitz4//scaffold67_size101165//95451//96298//NITZ4_004546-RA/size101165-augustus-gene-0.18-mRNA-1//1//CDS//3329556525//1873//frame0